MKQDMYHETQPAETISEIIKHISHLLPAQAPLKDFIHHNTLHQFQSLPFHKGMQEAQKILGVKTYLSPQEYFEKIKLGELDPEIAFERLKNRGFDSSFENRVIEAIHTRHTSQEDKRPHRLRDVWKNHYKLDVPAYTQPHLFRQVSHFLDQGISLWKMPYLELGFYKALQKIADHSKLSMFKKRHGHAESWLKLAPNEAIEKSLEFLVGKKELYETYLTEMSLEHPGWSGLVNVVSENPVHLHFPRQITLAEFMAFELLLEVDFAESQLGAFKPLSLFYHLPHAKPSSPSVEQVMIEVLQEALEWTLYRDVLSALKYKPPYPQAAGIPKYQAFFCIDDRECSLRNYLEELSPDVQTWGTPGFFGVEFYYKGKDDNFPVKLCPAPMDPQFLVKELENTQAISSQDLHFHGSSHTFFRGWLISQTLGFTSAIKLFLNIFRPSFTPFASTSLRHTYDTSQLKIERTSDSETENGKRLGFNHNEMADRVFGMLNSVGLKRDFAPLVLILGHGSSTINNPHYAAYDCGACSGRPGSINARVFCYMANHPEVRKLVAQKGIDIPSATVFVPGLHDTTRDEFLYYGVEQLDEKHKQELKEFDQLAVKALAMNSKERARRFESVPLDATPEVAREAMALRSVSIFEPRPEYNHATNTLCLIGPRNSNIGIYFDRRAFFNSYDPANDPSGDILANIMRAAVPVCGGINLEYYFSRVDNLKLGAGTKLPHNVMGLLGVANGTDGDLRPGLPAQMVEIHDPIRLLMVVDQTSEVALAAAKKVPATYEWIRNEWIYYASIDPKTRNVFVFQNGTMVPYHDFKDDLKQAPHNFDIFGKNRENVRIGLITGAAR